MQHVFISWMFKLHGNLPAPLREQPAIKTWNFFTFSFFEGLFALLDPDPDPADQISMRTHVDPDPLHCKKSCNNYLLIDSSLGHHGVGSGYWHGHLMPITTPSDKKSTDQRGERSLAGPTITRAPPSGADLALWSRSWLWRSFDHWRSHPHISFIFFTSFSTKFLLSSPLRTWQKIR